MKRSQLLMILLFLLFCAVSTAHAQSGYVAASLNADIVRNGTIDESPTPGTGEALSFSLRAGHAITSKFGVELDFTRPSAIESDETSEIFYPDMSLVFVDGFGLPGSIGGSDIFRTQIHLKQRTTTITAAAWARQEITSRFSVVYLGGVAFARRAQDLTASSAGIPLALAPFLPSIATHTVDYSAGPMVGAEAPIGMTEHVRLVPGMRLLALNGGWTLRPAVALGWTF